MGCSFLIKQDSFSSLTLGYLAMPRQDGFEIFDISSTALLPYIILKHNSRISSKAQKINVTVEVL